MATTTRPAGPTGTPRGSFRPALPAGAPPPAHLGPGHGGARARGPGRPGGPGRRAGLGRRRRPTAPSSSTRSAFTTIVPVCALMFASSALGDMVDDRTLVYVWLTPGRRGAGWPSPPPSPRSPSPCPSPSCPSTSPPPPPAPGPSWCGPRRWPPRSGTVGYCGLFTALGLRFRRALVWGIAYILVWEGFVATASDAAASLSLRAYTASILSQATGRRPPARDAHHGLGHHRPPARRPRRRRPHHLAPHPHRRRLAPVEPWRPSRATTRRRRRGRSCGWRSRPWGRWRPSRSTSWPTPPSSATSAPPQLGGLGVASTILLTGYTVFIFLAYGTTGAVARLIGAGDERGAAHQAVQGLWLAAGLGRRVRGRAVGARARPLIALLGAEGDVGRPRPRSTCASRCSGLPALLVTLAGTGYLRGLQDTRTPLVVAVDHVDRQPGAPGRADRGLRPGHRRLGPGHGARPDRRRRRLPGQVVGGGPRAPAPGCGPTGPPSAGSATIGRDLLVRTAALRLALGAVDRGRRPARASCPSPPTRSPSRS